MKIFFAVVAVWLTAVPLALAQTSLNPPYGDPAYRPYSVFSPDASEPKNARPDIIVVLHGFRSAVPNSTYKRIREVFRETRTVIGLNYDPLDIERTRGFLDDVEKRWLRGRRVVVLGTSMGGFWANIFGHRVAAEKIVLLNPVVDPSRQLAKYAGETTTNQRRARTFSVEASAIQHYESIKSEFRVDIPTLVLLTADDERLDHRLAEEMFTGKKDATVVVFPEGGHTMNLRNHRARAAIVDFVSRN